METIIVTDPNTCPFLGPTNVILEGSRICSKYDKPCFYTEYSHIDDDYYLSFVGNYCQKENLQKVSIEFQLSPAITISEEEHKQQVDPYK